MNRTLRENAGALVQKETERAAGTAKKSTKR
jgi:hypothetical protein